MTVTLVEIQKNDCYDGEGLEADSLTGWEPRLQSSRLTRNYK